MTTRNASRTRVATAQRLMVVVALCASGCSLRSRSAEAYPELAEHAGREIREVRFEGGAPFRPDTLQAVVETRPTRCALLGLPFCLPFTNVGRETHQLSPDAVLSDLTRLSLFYRREGYFGTSVQPRVEAAGDGVRVTFAIRRADPVRLASVEIGGLAGIVAADSVVAELPSRPGDIFHLGTFAASADEVLRTMRARGHAYAEVLRNFSVDTATDRAVVNLEAIPGPVVAIDSIQVDGAVHLDRGTALRQLTIREGDLLLLSELVESQRNLYGLELVQFASVSIAPDSLQASPEDSTRATVLVRVAEAPVHQVDAAVSWGNVECFRTEARWESRNFGGGARRLVLNGSASKIGIGQGLGGSLCSAFRADTFADPIDYLVGADLTQPLSPGNALTLALFAERQSEPNVYQRAAVGGRVGFNRRLSERAFLRVGADVERGSTLASDVLFCGAFQVCDPDAIARLTGARFRNTIGATVTRDATNQPIDPSTGHVARTGLTWAPPWLLSDVTFVRWNGEVAAYRELQPGWVGAVSLRLGNFFQTASPDSEDDFLPPEDRFYAGGATTVRGYDRNALGPGLYVTDELEVDSVGRPVIDVDTGEKIPVPGAARFSASGGTALMLFNLEVRFPSPVFSKYLRLATFVDAGSVTTEQLWTTSLGEVKITPGFGLRLQTPVGPVRVDVAYNPNGPPVAPLYFADPETGVLTRILDDFQQEPGSFLGRFRIHLAVGQAF